MCDLKMEILCKTWEFKLCIELQHMNKLSKKCRCELKPELTQ